MDSRGLGVLLNSRCGLRRRDDLRLGEHWLNNKGTVQYKTWPTNTECLKIPPLLKWTMWESSGIMVRLLLNIGVLSSQNSKLFPHSFIRHYVTFWQLISVQINGFMILNGSTDHISSCYWYLWQLAPPACSVLFLFLLNKVLFLVWTPGNQDNPSQGHRPGNQRFKTAIYIYIGNKIIILRNRKLPFNYQDNLWAWFSLLTSSLWFYK